MSSREIARTPRQVFGAMLRYYRERAGLSRTELARQISKSVSLIQAIELGQRAATCVWRKTSYSGANGGGCVEVASTAKTAVAVRDSKDPNGSKLAFVPSAWNRLFSVCEAQRRTWANARSSAYSGRDTSHSGDASKLADAGVHRFRR